MHICITVHHIHIKKTSYMGRNMALSITKDILSITELKRNTTAILNQLHATGRPVVLTVNGKAEAVIMDAAEYEKTTSALNLLKMLIPAEKDLKEGRTGESGTFFKEFKRARNI